MQHSDNLVIVGGTCRNVGKTEFICRLIAKISKSYEVYALKVSAIFPDELAHHGDHGDSGGGRQLFEETRRDSKKDTSRMLRAGAARVFFLSCEDDAIEEGYRAFLQHVPSGAVIVCESNSLAEFVSPSLDIMVKASEGEVKKRAVNRLKRADMVVLSDGMSGFAELENIFFDPGKGWFTDPYVQVGSRR